MEGFSSEKDPHLQFSKTLFISSIFFLIGSFLQFVAANTYIGCRIKEGLFEEGASLTKLMRPFLLIYGGLILAMFVSSTKMEWHHMVAPVIFYGFHNIVMLHLIQRISFQRPSGKTTTSISKLLLYSEVPIL